MQLRATGAPDDSSFHSDYRTNSLKIEKLCPCLSRINTNLLSQQQRSNANQVDILQAMGAGCSYDAVSVHCILNGYLSVYLKSSPRSLMAL